MLPLVKPNLRTRDIYKNHRRADTRHCAAGTTRVVRFAFKYSRNIYFAKVFRFFFRQEHAHKKPKTRKDAFNEVIINVGLYLVCSFL